MMYSAWKRISELIGDDFYFVDTYYDPGGTNLCIGITNGVETTVQDTVYAESLSNYRLELESFLLYNKQKVKKIIESRTEPLVNWLATHPSPEQFRDNHPYQIEERAIESYSDGTVGYAEIHDPPCTGTKINAYSAYYHFIEQVIQSHKEFLNQDRGKGINGFPYPRKNTEIHNCYNYLLQHGFIEGYYKDFKNIFTESASIKTNWKKSYASLRYFINEITAPTKIKCTLKWKRAANCFQVDGESFENKDLSGARKKLDDKKIKSELDEAVKRLFPSTAPPKAVD